MAATGFSQYPLHERLLKALEKLAIQEPTDVQAGTLDFTLAGKDVLFSARTGSGKTYAYLLPLINSLMAKELTNSATRALILVPTRELARQVHKDCLALTSFTHLKAGVVTGGEGLKVQQAQLRKNPEIVIATPGRVGEHLQRRSIELADLEFLVLDEADRMLDLGFKDDLVRIANELNDPKTHQALVCSATLNHGEVSRLANEYLVEPEMVELADAGDSAQIIQQIVLADDSEHKKKLLSRLLNEEDSYQQAIVFSNTRAMAEQLGGYLTYYANKNDGNFRTAVLHGEMEHDERKRVMALFQTGKVDVLVATDVAARGLDIEDVGLVINFDMSRRGDDYVHRIGRTGRAGRSGLAISFVTSNEWNMMSSIERYLKVHFERRVVAGLEGVFKGPKKLKASGKAASTVKRNKTDKKAKSTTDKKGKQRVRDRKAIGKRRKPAEKTEAENRLGDGFVPLKKPR